MSQNLISATLAPADAAEVQQCIATAKAKLSFLISMAPGDVSGIIKVGNVYIPFIDLAYQVVIAHPEILPAVFDKDEFLSDYALFSTIRPILTQINELAEGLQKTYIAAGSDTMVAALDVYATVKQNKDKVAVLDATATQMANFFKKTKAVAPAIVQSK